MADFSNPSIASQTAHNESQKESVIIEVEKNDIT